MKTYPIVICGAENPERRATIQGRRYLAWDVDPGDPKRYLSVDGLIASLPLWEGATCHNYHTTHTDREGPRVQLGVVTRPIWDNQNWRLCATLAVPRQSYAEQIDAYLADGDMGVSAQTCCFSYWWQSMEMGEAIVSARYVDVCEGPYIGGRVLAPGEPAAIRALPYRLHPSWLAEYGVLVPGPDLIRASRTVARLTARAIGGEKVRAELAEARRALAAEKQRYLGRIGPWIEAHATT